MKSLILLLCISSLFALPRFSVEEGASCVSCHVNPTGSGMRNDYGSNVYSLDELTMRKWINKGDEDWDGYISDHIQIGGEFRIQSFQGNVSEGTFPMQAEIYATANINKKAVLYIEASLDRDNMNNEYFVLFNKLPNKSWIKIGNSYPTYGLMIDDHTSFIKSGNKNSLYILEPNLDNGFRQLFNPKYRKPLIIEGSTQLSDNLNLIVSISQPSQPSNGSKKDKNLNTYNSSMNYSKNFNFGSLLIGTSFMKQDTISLAGIYGGLSFKDFTMTYEIDKADKLFNDHKDQTSLATYYQLVYKPIQGLHIITKYDFFDHDYEFESGSVSRYSFGFELYPLNVLEIKIQARQYEIDNIDLNLDTEYLLQIHTWF